MGQISIACVGDVMCGDSFYAIGSGAGTSMDKYGFDFLDRETVTFLRSHDIVIGNVEGCLSDIGRDDRSLRSLHMRGRAKTADYLRRWGITAASAANNHILEQGVECAIDTVENLKRAGIKVAGAGRNGQFEKGIEAAEIKIGNQVVSILNICLLKERYAFDGGGGLEEFIDEIKRRSGCGETVIVSVHWGRELVDRPTLEQRKIAERFAEAGARLIIGHHPHVVQGVEEINGSLVAYSLGNFIFDSFFEDTRWSFILSVKLDGDAMSGWDCVATASDREHRPYIAKKAKREKLDAEIGRRSELLQRDVEPDEYRKRFEMDFRELDIQSRKQMRRGILKGITGYKAMYLPQLLLRPVRRRLGAW